MAPPSSGGASVLATFSGSRAADPGRLYSTQCTQVPAGASGSSAMRAKAAVPAGAPLQASDGETSTPSQVCFTGIAVPCRNAVLVSENAMRSSPSRTVASVTVSARTKENAAGRLMLNHIQKLSPRHAVLPVSEDRQAVVRGAAADYLESPCNAVHFSSAMHASIPRTRPRGLFVAVLLL